MVDFLNFSQKFPSLETCNLLDVNFPTEGQFFLGGPGVKMLTKIYCNVFPYNNGHRMGETGKIRVIILTGGF
jgi:hypothetical protein